MKGAGNSINYKYRMHDPRLGRFFAVDPLAAKYPHNSVYAFSENRVIDGVELEGLEYVSATDAGFTHGFMGPFTEDQTATQEKYEGYIDFNNTVEYNGETYFNVGQHLYQSEDGNISSVQSDGATKVTEWVYTDIQLFDKSEHHIYRFYDPTVVGSYESGTDYNADCAYLGLQQHHELGNYTLRDEIMKAEKFNIFAYNANTDVVLQNEDAIDYINRQLEAGKSIMVGVSHDEDFGLDDYGTNHWVLITGRTFADGNGQFLFMENASGDKNEVIDFGKNRLTPSSSGINGGSAYFGAGTFKLTRVQYNK